MMRCLHLLATASIYHWFSRPLAPSTNPKANSTPHLPFVSADWVVFLAHYWRSQELANAATETDSSTSNATECAIEIESCRFHNFCSYGLLHPMSSSYVICAVIWHVRPTVELETLAHSALQQRQRCHRRRRRHDVERRDFGLPGPTVCRLHRDRHPSFRHRLLILLRNRRLLPREFVCCGECCFGWCGPPECLRL